MMNHKKLFTKKKVTGVATLLVALAIILTGTFAWKDFSQSTLSLFSADAVSRHWVSLVDEFALATTTGTNTKTLTGWKSGVASAKEVYVTSNPNDQNVTDRTGYDSSSTNYDPVYVRAKLEQTLTLGGVSGTKTANTNISENQYDEYVRWTQNGEIKTIDDWFSDGSPRDEEYWILDSDGWLYWAKPLEFGDKTDNLLDKVELLIEPDKDLEYTVNVELEAVSSDLKSAIGYDAALKI